ncbi:MAG TPA: hypothetical protein VGD77_04530 [Gemmatimonadaceae bacterium]
MSIPLKPVLGAALALAMGCVDAGVPTATHAPIAAASVEASTANLIVCPSDRTVSTSGVLGLLGGELSAGGVTVSVPVGAMLSPTTIDVTVPASPYMEVDVSVPGVEHFYFQQPITVTVDYGRCDPTVTSGTSLNVWYIDSGSKQPLELMPTVDNKLAHTVTFTTPHLSGYALAN